MSSSNNNQRLNVFPTRMSLNLMKTKLKGAQTGHSLLKRKSDALSARFRAILSRIRAAKYDLSELMKTAALSMAQVNYTAGDISYAVRESVTGPAAFQISCRLENVSGVQLPCFEAFGTTGCAGEASSGEAFESTSSVHSSASTNTAPLGANSFTAMSRGGQQVQRCREANLQFLRAALALASLQTSFRILEYVIRVTNRRVNALEYVILPRTENTINYITGELDEQDREEFFRLKKVQGKKKQRAALEAENCANEGQDEDGDQDEYGTHHSLLEAEKDPDLIF